MLAPCNSLPSPSVCARLPILPPLLLRVLGLIRDIHDPEHPHTIEELGVVFKHGVRVHKSEQHEYVDVEFKPTVPHCTLATLIGLCIRTKVITTIPNIKVPTATRRHALAWRERHDTHTQETHTHIHLYMPIQFSIHIQPGAHQTEHESSSTHTATPKVTFSQPEGLIPHRSTVLICRPLLHSLYSSLSFFLSLPLFQSTSN